MYKVFLHFLNLSSSFYLLFFYAIVLKVTLYRQTHPVDGMVTLMYGINLFMEYSQEMCKCNVIITEPLIKGTSRSLLCIGGVLHLIRG